MGTHHSAPAPAAAPHNVTHINTTQAGTHIGHVGLTVTPTGAMTDNTSDLSTIMHINTKGNGHHIGHIITPSGEKKQVVVINKTGTGIGKLVGKVGVITTGTHIGHLVGKVGVNTTGTKIGKVGETVVADGAMTDNQSDLSSILNINTTATGTHIGNVVTPSGETKKVIVVNTTGTGIGHTGETVVNTTGTGIGHTGETVVNTTGTKIGATGEAIHGAMTDNQMAILKNHLAKGGQVKVVSAKAAAALQNMYYHMI